MKMESSTEIKNNRAGFKKSLLGILFKITILFIVLNLLFAMASPLTILGKFSLYNHLFPGRLRLPYGDIPQQAYNLSLFNLEAMFASHELAGTPKASDEYRVILIGDSATWGYLQSANETLAAAINNQKGLTQDGRQIKVYNLGYPVMSLMKDLLILSYAMRYDPDLIVWPVTLESFPFDKQLFPPLLQNNPSPVISLIKEYDLPIPQESPELKRESFIDKTIIGARRQLADLIRLQLYGIMWAATGIDQYIPDDYIPRQEDLEADIRFHDLQPDTFKETDLAFSVLEAGVSMASGIPILIVNEPMFISQGLNSDIRYNFYYPRWVYDQYRVLMQTKSITNNWYYIDMWDIVPASEFTNSAVHMTTQGTQLFAGHLLKGILQIASQRSEP